MKSIYRLLAVLSFATAAFGAFAQGFETYTVFKEGENRAHCHRIPALVTANDNSLIAVAEARWQSWVDKTRTDVVLRRSTDLGRTWSPIINLSKDSTGAYMDPCPVVDSKTGRIFIFMSFWPTNDHSGKSNKAFVVSSDNNGETWSPACEITNEIAPGNLCVLGFGPGSGLQIQGGEHKGRLVVPVRMFDGTDQCEGKVVSYYSDDSGRSWKLGQYADRGGEVQYAESPKGTLVANIRAGGSRWVARSVDGGVSWNKSKIDPALVTVSKGCQSSVYGKGKVLWYSGITGRVEDPQFDQRADLTLFRSNDGGHTWGEKTLIYDHASGYSCISFLRDGRMVILYESSDTQGFARSKERKDWMRIDVTILPKAKSR